MDDVLSRVLKFYGFILVMAFGLSVVVLCFRLLIILRNNPDAVKTNKEIAVEEQWDVYYNGQEVDIENIDLSLYECSYDRDNKKVFVTDKRSSSGSNGLLWFFLGKWMR